MVSLAGVDGLQEPVVVGLELLGLEHVEHLRVKHLLLEVGDVVDDHVHQVLSAKVTASPVCNSVKMKQGCTRTGNFSGWQSSLTYVTMQVIQLRLYSTFYFCLD